MGDKKGDTTKKQQPQQPQQQQQQQILPSPNDPLDVHHPQQPQSVVSISGAAAAAASSFNIPPPLFVPPASSSLPFDQQQQFESPLNPKRPRYTPGQWKTLPSPSSQQKQTQKTILTPESTPSPNPKTTQLALPHANTSTAAASSTDTASSTPPHSPLPSLSATSGQDTNKTEGDPQNIHHRHQFRKGKYVSPVWKPNEMLWLARGWRIQYQGGGAGSEHGSGSSSRTEQLPTESTCTPGHHTRTKTRADKDREVAEFLQKHGVKRDAKTAGTKWDNMLGEFRKVYEWERGAERDQVGKSYFRLSPYERKLHRLPASFDEQVFEELSQFMAGRMRTPQSRLASDDFRTSLGLTRTLTQPSPFKEDDFPLSGRTKQLMIMSGGGEPFYHGGKGTLLGFHHHDPSSSLDLSAGLSSSSLSKELRRIGKIRMVWEESVSLWAEEGEHHRGRVRLQGSSFLNADELTFFDDSMVACTMEAFEDGALRGFSVDRFVSGQQVKVFGRRKPPSATSGFVERVHLPLLESSSRSISPYEFHDPTEHCLACLRVPPQSLPSLSDLQWYIQDPPPEELRFPLRKDVYRDLPQGKEIFFTTSTEFLDCRAITYDILSPIIRTNHCLSASTATSRDSFIPIWDDCINRIVSKFSSLEIVFIRKPNTSTSTDPLQDQWPNMTGFVRNICLWRGEEADQVREGHHTSRTIGQKLVWTFMDLPYLLGYYAIGHVVTFCALSRDQAQIIRTDLCTFDLSLPSDRLKALVPCYRIAGLLPLLADKCVANSPNCNGGCYNKLLPYSDFQRIDMGNGNIIEMTPKTVTRFFPNLRKWTAAKEIYDFLDHRIPHAETIQRVLDKELGLVFKPRGCKMKPTNCEQLVEALKYVTTSLVALHDLSFMHRDISWEKVLRKAEEKGESEWFICGFEEAVGAPQIYPHRVAGETAGSGRHAPEMERGLHGVKVDVWGVGNLVKSCGLTGVPKMLRELQNRCLDQNPEQRPTAADCYHHLLQLQSVTAGGVMM